MKKEKQEAPNVLEMIPTHAVDFEFEEGRVVMLAPKFKNKFFVKHIMRRMKSPFYRIHLDEYGSQTWNLVDGKKTVFEIGKELKAKYGESVEPVYERLGLFMNMLAQRRFITLSQVWTRTE